MKLIFHIFIQIVLLNCSVSNAQVSIKSIEEISFLNIDAIKSADKIIGYYAFVQIKSTSKKEKLFQLNIYDTKLTLTSSNRIIKKGKNVTKALAFNGSHFCIFLQNIEIGTMSINYTNTECQIYDLKGNLTGNFAPSWAGSPINDFDFSSSSGPLASIPNKGFIIYEYPKKRYGELRIEAFTNTGTKLWESKTAIEGLSNESIQFCYSNQVELFNIVRLRRNLGNGFNNDLYLQIRDINTGVIKQTTNCLTNESRKIPFGVSFDSITQEYLVYGNYGGELYEGTDYNRLGLYIQRIDNNGSIKAEKLISWEKEIEPMISKNTYDEKNFSISGLFLHSLILLPNGNHKIIGERFIRRKKVLLAATLNGPTLYEDQIENIFILELNAKFELDTIKVVTKTNHDAILNSMENVSGEFGSTANNYNALMLFDYCYLNNRNIFTYLDIEKLGKANSTYKIINKKIYAESNSTESEGSFKSNTNRFKILPSAIGNVVIAEYFANTKELKLREIKID